MTVSIMSLKFLWGDSLIFCKCFTSIVSLLYHLFSVPVISLKWRRNKIYYCHRHASIISFSVLMRIANVP
jgi:hypothetical protein